MENSLIQKGKPVTKAAVLGELNRPVDLYRNNGCHNLGLEESGGVAIPLWLH
ncbi:MAG: hypothetical protein R2765_07945 [Ferruginibacter sp.]